MVLRFDTRHTRLGIWAKRLKREMNMRVCRLSIYVVLLWGILGGSAFAATPSFTLTASNVSMSDMGTGTSSFTVTSVNGFTGQVGVVCTGPNTILLNDLVLPACDAPTMLLAVPANGSVKGTMTFRPPWTARPAVARVKLRRPLTEPLGAGALTAALLGFGLRKRLHRWIVVLLLCGAGLAGFSGLAGGLGTGGLAMTPGTYSYAIAGGTAAGESATIKVTVNE